MRVSPDAAVQLGSFDGEMFNIDDIPAQVQAVRNDLREGLEANDNRTADGLASIAAMRTTTEAALNDIRASATADNTATQNTLSQLETRINGQVTARLNGVAAQANGAATTATNAAVAASRAYNASICSAGGQLYNRTTNSCTDNTAGLDDPDWVSNWAYMRSQRAAAGSFHEWTWCTVAAQCTERRKPPSRQTHAPCTTLQPCGGLACGLACGRVDGARDRERCSDGVRHRRDFPPADVGSFACAFARPHCRPTPLSVAS